MAQNMLRENRSSCACFRYVSCARVGKTISIPDETPLQQRGKMYEIFSSSLFSIHCHYSKDFPTTKIKNQRIWKIINPGICFSLIRWPNVIHDCLEVLNVKQIIDL